jgi:hypothetical protein
VADVAGEERVTVVREVALERSERKLLRAVVARLLGRKGIGFFRDA